MRPWILRKGSLTPSSLAEVVIFAGIGVSLWFAFGRPWVDKATRKALAEKIG